MNGVSDEKQSLILLGIGYRIKTEQMFETINEGARKMSVENNSEILIYQTEDGQTKIDVRMEKETVWLSLNQLAELFQRDKSVISKHIKNVFDEGELSEDSTVANFATVQNEGKRAVERGITAVNDHCPSSYYRHRQSLC